MKIQVMTQQRIYRISWLVVILLSLVAAPSLQAQVLEEIVVTAQKREQNLQDVGISVTALTGNQIREMGFQSATDVISQIPGVQYVQPNGPAAFSLAIRGFSQGDFADHQESPAAVYVDEAYVSQPAGLTFLLFDLERVEVLRGPQGTLFGRNATTGLAHYITRKPSDTPEGYVQVTAASYEQIKTEGAISGPLSESIRGRVSFASNNHEGYYKNLEGQDLHNGNSWAGRGQVAFDIGESAELTLNVRAANEDIRAGAWNSVPTYTAANGFGEFVPPGGTQNGTCPGCNFFGTTGNDFDPFVVNPGMEGFSKIKTTGGGAKLVWDLNEELTLTSVTDTNTLDKLYLEDSDTTPVAEAFNFGLFNDVKQISQELRLNGSVGDGVNWIAGLFYLDIDGSYFIADEQPDTGSGPEGGPYGNYFPYQMQTKSTAVFGQVEKGLTDQLRLIVGARWTEDKKDYHYDAYGQDVGLGSLVEWRPGHDLILASTTGVPFSFTGSADDDFVSGRVSLEWTIKNDTLLFASWNRGVKAGGFNAPNAPASVVNTTVQEQQEFFSFDPEQLDSFEVGFKSDFNDGKTRLNGTAWYYDYKDYQAFQSRGTLQLVFNSDATAYGGELEVATVLAEGLEASLGLSYVNTDLDPLDPGNGIVTGDLKPALTADYNANGLIRYSWPAFNGTLTAQADFVYVSEYFLNLSNAPAVREDGYAVGNARLAYRTADEKSELALFVNNVWDEEYVTMAFDLAGFFGLTQQFYGKPRWAGVTFSHFWD